MSFDRNNSFKNNYNDLSKNNHADNPPMSRLFIICSRQNTEADFRKSFEKFGTIEEIWLVKDRNTNENKGKPFSVPFFMNYILIFVTKNRRCCVH